MTPAPSSPPRLSATTAGALSELIQDITGGGLRSQVISVPILMLSSEAMHAALPLPDVKSGDILIHDYQAVDMSSELPMDEVLDAQFDRLVKGNATEFIAELNGAMTLRTALRAIPKADFSSAKPLNVRPEDLTGPTLGPIHLGPCHLQNYLTLAEDPNPIHRDSETLRDLGLTRPIVPGLMLMALIDPLIQTVHPKANVTKLRARSAAPLLLGDPLSISLQGRGTQKAADKITMRTRAIIHRLGQAVALVDLTLNVSH